MADTIIDFQRRKLLQSRAEGEAQWANLGHHVVKLDQWYYLIYFCGHHPNSLLPSLWDTKKTMFLCWPRCIAGCGMATRAQFWPKNRDLFTLCPYNTHFFLVRRIWLNRIIGPPHPQLTLGNFDFPVGGRLAAWRALFRPQQPKVTLTRQKHKNGRKQGSRSSLV